MLYKRVMVTVDNWLRIWWWSNRYSYGREVYREFRLGRFAFRLPLRSEFSLRRLVCIGWGL